MGLCLEEIARAEELPAVVLSVTVSGVAPGTFRLRHGRAKTEMARPHGARKRHRGFRAHRADAGSDNNSLRTSAVLEGDEWVINGTKQFITNAGLDNTSIVIVAAKTERPKDGKTIVCTIIVPKDAPGFKVGAKYEKMGNHGYFYPRTFLRQLPRTEKIPSGGHQ